MTCYSYCLSRCAFTSQLSTLLSLLVRLPSQPTDGTIWSGGLLFSYDTSLRWDIGRGPLTSSGKEEEMREELAYAAHSIPPFLRAHPTSPSFLDLKISPVLPHQPHWEKREKGEEREQRNSHFNLFKVATQNSTPSTMVPIFVVSQTLLCPWPVFRLSLHWTWSWVEGSKRKEPWVCPRNKRTSNHLASNCIMELSRRHPSHHAHIHTHTYPSIFVFRRTLKAICNH